MHTTTTTTTLCILFLFLPNKPKKTMLPLCFGKSEASKIQEIKRKKLDMTIISYYIFFPIKAVLGTTDKCHVNNMMTMMMMMLLLWRWLSKVG